MTKRYYLDTSIWRDYFENRSDKFRPLGEWAFTLIKIIIKYRSLILYSDLVIEELREKYSDQEIDELYEFPKKYNLLLKVNISQSQTNEAKKLSKQRHVPYADALHAILARDNNAVVVTRDKHFNSLRDIVKIYKPEELI